MKKTEQQPIRIVLCETSHPGNIGAAARAMKNMGLHRLILVSPAQFPHPEAMSRASGADDVLANALVVRSLEEAIKDCQWVFGTSSRDREFPWPQLTPKMAAEKIQTQQEEQIAIVFGTERAGLTNEQLQQCDYHIAIPADPDYPSLNLAQAVQVICYEIFTQDKILTLSRRAGERKEEKATREEVEGLLSHFEETALKLNFIVQDNPKKLIPKLKRLFAKSQLDKDEINILRGFLKMVQLRIKA